MSIELKQAAQQVLDAFEAFGEADDFATLFTLTQKTNALRTAIQQPATPEPFGYFRAMPFGWEQCAETDEGAKALYEHPAPIALEAPKDNQIAALVNKVRDIARMFHGHQSLRERIAIELVPALKASQDVQSNAERWIYAIADGGNQSMNFIDIFGDWDGDGDFVEVFDAARLADKKGGAA